MLVLLRQVGETIRIGDAVSVTVLEVDRGQVKLGTRAPPAVAILRQELESVGGTGDGEPAD